jgi:hypothetical protein
VQVVARVEVIDELSRRKLTTEYRYHHGYWDGAEREISRLRARRSAGHGGLRGANESLFTADRNPHLV